MAVTNKNVPSVDFPLQMQRQFGAPLDGSAVYYSLDDAKSYAKNSPLAYAGQLISVVDEQSNAVKIYKIAPTGDLADVEDFLPTTGGTIDGKLQVNDTLTVTGLHAKHNHTQEEGVVFLLSKLTASNFNTDNSNQVFFRELLKWICAYYPNKKSCAWTGVVAPNSTGHVILTIYDTSKVNSSTGLPQYSSGCWISVTGKVFNFSTFDYAFSINSMYDTANKPSASDVGALPLGGGTVSGETTFQTGQFHFKSGAVAGASSNLPYILGIKPFAEGGDVMYRSFNDFAKDLGFATPSDVNTAIANAITNALNTAV